MAVIKTDSDLEKRECVLTSSESHQRQRGQTPDLWYAKPCPQPSQHEQKLRIWLEASCQPLNPLMFRPLTDVQEESRDKTAR